MKNWKRFIAACLSVTMVASIPLTAFAESSVSVKELAPKASKESETQEETDLEKILSQEKPYEYFSGLKDQEKLLDACKDEELFQLKEYMKYAYIHESDLKNRQSLDAYLLISKTWRDRKITFEKEEQEQLLQFLKETKVYGTKYNTEDKEGKNAEKTVQDFPSFMEYLQSIKQFDVPKYMELLSAFDEVKTEEDLANAKDAFSNFEEETFGFDEQENEAEKDSKMEVDTDSKENPIITEKADSDSPGSNTAVQKVIVAFSGYNSNGYIPMKETTISIKDKAKISQYLEKKIEVRLSDGAKEIIDVDWECEFDPNKTDYAVYTYNLILPKGYTVSKKLNDLYDKREGRLPYIDIKIKESLNQNFDDFERPFTKKPVYAESSSDERAGTEINGYPYDYEVYNISAEGDWIKVNAWAYTWKKNHTGKVRTATSTQDLINRVYAGENSVGYYIDVKDINGNLVGSYCDYGGKRIDHTSVWNFQGDPSKSPTLTDIGSEFWIPLSDVRDKGELTITLHVVRKDIGDAGFAVQYLSPSAYFEHGSDTINFIADGIRGFSPSGYYTYCNTNPYKGGGHVTGGSGNAYLYFYKGDSYSQLDGTWTGKISRDSYETTWYECSFTATNNRSQSGTGWYVKPSNPGKTGWIPSAFVDYSLSNFRLRVDTNSYNITYKGNGGVWNNTDTWTTKAAYGKPYYTEQNFFWKQGYHFTGWNESPDGTGTDWTYSIGKPWVWDYKRDVVLYAQWAPNTYQVTYNGNGGYYNNNPTWSEYTVYDTNYTTWDNFFNREGYVFAGWNEKPDGSGTSWTNYIGKAWKWQYPYDLTLYAQWKPLPFTATYKGNGGTWNGTDTWSETVYYGTSYKAQQNFFDRYGYNFIGWNESPNGNGSDWTANIETPWIWSYLHDATLYAQWTPWQCRLVYDGNGGTYNGSSTWETRVTFDTDYVTEKNFFDRKGYTFIGWNEKPDGTGTNWTDWIGKPWKWSTGDLTLYAQWVPNTYQITYKGNGGTWNGTNTWSESVAYDSMYYTQPEFFKREGYEFLGWNTDPNGKGSDWTSWIGQPWKWQYDHDITLYAQWGIKTFQNTVSHWMWGMKNQEGNNNSKTAFLLDTTYFKKNYGDTYLMDEAKGVQIPLGFTLCDFGTSYLTGAWNSYPLGTHVTQKDQAGTFEYNYQPNNYNIAYNLNGGINHKDNPTSYNILYGVNLQEPTKNGYLFKGWNMELFRKKDVILNSGTKDGDTYVFKNNTTDNVFTASKIQLYSDDGQIYYDDIAFMDASQNGVGKFTYKHTMETGNYKLHFGANGKQKDAIAFLEHVYFEKNKTYTIAYDSQVTNDEVRMKDISVTHIVNLSQDIEMFEPSLVELNGNQRNGSEFTIKVPTSGNVMQQITVLASSGNNTQTIYSTGIQQGIRNLSYQHKLASGTYHIRFAANGTKGVAYISKYVYLEQNQFYQVSFEVMPSASDTVILKDISLKTKGSGINVGKGAPLKGGSYTYKELAKRQIGDIKLSALWEPKSYQNTIKHVFVGVTTENGEPIYYPTEQKITVRYGEKLPKVNLSYGLLPKGYALDSYYEVESNGAKKNVLINEEITQDANSMTITYRYKPINYNIHYQLDGGNNPADNPVQYNILQKVIFKDPTKTGHEFLGWYIDSQKVTGINETVNGSSKFADFDALRKAMQDRQTGDVSLMAKWKLKAIIYTVIYDGNTATSGTTPNSTHVVGTPSPLNKNGYTKTGYQFQNWNTEPDGTGTSYTDEQVVDKLASTNGETITLYAQWKPNKMTVKYHLNGGTDVSSDNIFTSNDPARTEVHLYPSISNNGLTDITTARVTPPTGYLIKGTWNMKADGSGTSFDFTTEYTLPQLSKQIETGDVIVDLYAEWTPKQLVTTFHKNDGSTTTATQTFTYDVAGQKFTDKKWTRTGYTLLGWADSKTATKAQYAILSGVSNAWIETHYPKNDVYAIWKTHTYTITYEGNGATGGSTPSSNHTYDKPQTLTPNGFHKDGYYFDSWNTKPDGTGNSYQDEEEVQNLTSKDGDTITLHAQWKPVDYKIIYKGNGSTGGTEKTHLYNQKDVEANGYTVKTNKGYTDFVRTNHTLVGWYQNSVVDTKAEMAKIYKQGSKLTYSQLLAIHAEQVKKGLVKETDPKVKDIILYAVWDEAPSIDTSNMKKSQFYEGVDVTRADLLNGITASDKIDGSLNSQIIITKIDYSAGKLVNGKKQAAYSQTWENGMPADAKLDTWFMQLDKNDSPVTHTITYQVKDSAGNITTAKKTIQVVYNEFPVIKANDFRFKLKEAQDGKITKDALLTKAIASGLISASDIEDGDIKSKIELIDYDANAFKTMKQEGFIPITYRVQDSMGPGGKGKVTLKTVNVNIIIDQKAETVRYVRFINKKYYEKNANLDRNALAGKYDQIALLSVNGGLHPFSVWYTETDYRKLITETFEKTKGTTYVYTKEDIKKMREFVKQHGVGNAKEEDALSKFADIFMTGDYILK